MSTNISEEDQKTYETVIAKFDDFFKVRKNAIFERARFNRRSQRQDEPVEQFITSLYSLAKNCAYGEMKGEMIRDRIVVGTRGLINGQEMSFIPRALSDIYTYDSHLCTHVQFGRAAELHKKTVQARSKAYRCHGGVFSHSLLQGAIMCSPCVCGWETPAKPPWLTCNQGTEPGHAG